MKEKKVHSPINMLSPVCRTDKWCHCEHVSDSLYFLISCQATNWASFSEEIVNIVMKKCQCFEWIKQKHRKTKLTDYFVFFSVKSTVLRQLLFHVDNGAGRITAEHVPEGEGFCDGRWHSVTANKLRHRVELVVDGQQSQAESPNTRSNTCDTSDPIYIGGYPGTIALHFHTWIRIFDFCTFLREVSYSLSLTLSRVKPLSTRPFEQKQCRLVQRKWFQHETKAQS